MKRPAFQFYPGDWKRNTKLRRCSEAARGAWVELMCLFHDSEEYGVLRWPLKEIIQAAGVSRKSVNELIQKGVMKGSDKDAAPYVYTPRHAGKDGTPATLVEADGGPCWYCSRFVRDEWVRQRRGNATQFSAENQPPKRTPNSPPIPPIGDESGDGPSSASSSSINTSVPIGTGATAPPDGLSAQEAIFQIGVPWFVDRGGKESNVRSLLGGAVKHLGADEAWSLVKECMEAKPIEAIAWMAGAINQRIPTARKPKSPQSFDKVDYSKGVSADGSF
jgi:hypothetical protein